MSMTGYFPFKLKRVNLMLGLPSEEYFNKLKELDIFIDRPLSYPLDLRLKENPYCIFRYSESSTPSWLWLGPVLPETGLHQLLSFEEVLYDVSLELRMKMIYNMDLLNV